MLVLDDDVLLNRTANAAEDIAFMAHLGMPIDAGVVQKRILDRLKRDANSPTPTEPEPVPTGVPAASR